MRAGARAPTIPVARFTTDVFVAEDRHEAWANRDWPSIGPIFDAVPTGQFHNRSDRFALGPITVHVADMGAQTYDRAAGRARRDGVDGLMIELLLAGSTGGDAAGIETRNLPGGMAFNDLAQAHRHASSDTHTLLLSIPRVVAERAGIDVRTLHGRHVSPAGTALLRSHLLATHAALPHLDAAAGERLGRTVIDLLTVALDIEGLREPAATRTAIDAATRLAVEQAIGANLGSPVLGVAWLARQIGVSPARLYRLFRPDGGLQTHIRNARLERIRIELSLAGPRASLATLAERWGFSDAAHLVRSFRERYEMTPGEYRALRQDDR